MCTADTADTFCARANSPCTTLATLADFDGFTEIGARLRPELALLPIGAYHPASFRNVHTSPEDALQAFVDLGARWMVLCTSVRFGCRMSRWGRAVPRLLKAAKKHGVEDRVCVLEEGVTRMFE